MKKQSLILALFIGFMITACGQTPSISDVSTASADPQATSTPTSSDGAAGSGAAAKPAVTAVATVSPSTTTESTSINLTMYQLSRTTAPQSSWPTKTYTATGYCVIYLSKTYCWDDGMKTVTISGFNFYYSYWNMSRDSSTTWSKSSGGMVADLMPTPRYISTPVMNNIGSSTVSSVLTTGSQTAVTCTSSSGTLNCVNFSIDLNQVAL